MQFIVRTFRRVIERGPTQPACDVIGGIEADAFVLSIDGMRFSIPTVRCGEDERGRFAVIEESEEVLDHGFRLAVEVNPPDSLDGPVGCTIRLFKPNRDLAAVQEALPEANVLWPPEAHVAINFRPSGDVCGSSIMYETPYPPGTTPPEVRH